jgi:predicted MFS family arabinose efflux permease
MTETTAATQSAIPRASLLTPEVVRFLLYAFLSCSAWAFPISVVPLFVERHSTLSALPGLMTGLMFFVTVLVELRTPHLMQAAGYQTVLAVGTALAGCSAALFLLTSATWAMVIVNAARGAGLALIVVAATAAAVELFPAERRAEGLGLYGLAITTPSVLIVPLGVWLVDAAGFGTVFSISFVLGALGVVLVTMVPVLAADDHSPHGLLRLVRTPAVLRPTLVFAVSTLAMGVILTYLALAVGEDVAALGLLVHGICMALSRWLSGRIGDALGPGRLFGPALLVAGLGIAAVSATDNATLVILGMVLFGLGFGAGQTASLAVLFARTDRSKTAHVSAIWNLAFDAGMGLGAVGFGLVTGPMGYPFGFLLLAGLVIASVIPAWLDRATSAA